MSAMEHRPFSPSLLLRVDAFAGTDIEDASRGLRAGDIVTAHGDGLAMRYTHGVLAIILVVTRDVELVTAREEKTA